ncbi:hypothetical protein [Streptomyces sp. NPDC091209]|uniref:hypothetical protein n=1 Tax=Streptomyces sp. NPDC091209 TaxID=3365974 RepID=UPI0037FACF0A
MARTPHEKHPPEGTSLGRDPEGELTVSVTYSTETSAARKSWWRVRAMVKRPLRVRRRTR